MRSRPRSILSLAFAAALAGPAASFQSDGSSSGEPTVPTDERAAERNRVLELSSGDRLRGMTRWVSDAQDPQGGVWEMREKGGWRALRSGAVSGWRDERDLVREAKRSLAQGVGREDLAQRVALADWMVEHGLEAEAVAELDRVLREEPDFDAALGLLARGEFERPSVGVAHIDPVGVRERLIALGSAPSPARRELVIQALRELEDVQGVREALLRELVAFRHRQRFFATHALRRLSPGQELSPLLRCAALDNSSEVRLGAALALRASGQPYVIVPLMRALSNPHGMVRTNAAEALGNIGFEAAVPALVNRVATLAAGGDSPRPPAGHVTVTNQVAYVQDYDVEIAQAASIADPIIQTVTEGVVLEGRSFGVNEYSAVTEFQTVRTALKTLTGHDAGRNPDKWLRWYEENRAKYEKPPVTSGK